MSDSTVEERFAARYRPAIESFVNDIEGLDASGKASPSLRFGTPNSSVPHLRQTLIK